MDMVAGSGGNRRLSKGLRRLDEWSKTASQIDRNAAYKALFAVSNGSVFRAYRVVPDLERSQDFCVIVRDDLAIRIRYRNLDSFGIEYIGTPDRAIGLDHGSDHAA